MKWTFSLLLILLIFPVSKNNALVIFQDKQGKLQYLDLENRSLVPYYFHQNQILNFQILSSSPWFDTYDSSYWNQITWFLGENYIQTLQQSDVLYHIHSDRVLVNNLEKTQKLQVYNFSDSANITFAAVYKDNIWLNQEDSLHEYTISDTGLIDTASWAKVKYMATLSPFFLMRTYENNGMTLSSLVDFDRPQVVDILFNDKILKSVSDEDLFLLSSQALYRLSPLTRSLEKIVKPIPSERFVDFCLGNDEIYVLTLSGDVACLDKESGELLSLVTIEDNIISMGIDEYLYLSSANYVYCLDQRNLKVSHKIYLKGGVNSRMIPVGNCY